jgi:multidrug efflux pump subunit AcrA (membrane-fusion protein)
MESGSRVGAVLKVLVPIALLAASLAGAGYLSSTRPAVRPSPATERVWTVRAQAVRLADHRPVLQLYGDLVAGRDVTLRPLVAGEVIEASPALVEGGRVPAGELVVRIDPFHYRIALRELAAQRQEAAARRTELESRLDAEWTMLRLDESQLELARRDLARREQLHGSAVGSEKALDDARMAVARHEAGLAQRRQAIATVQAQLVQQEAVIERLGAAIERAERDLANTELRAPFAGLVTEVTAAVGKHLGVGDPVARLIDQSHIEIQEESDQGAQHGYAGDEQMVRVGAPGVEEFAPGHEHADRVQRQRRAVGDGPEQSEGQAARDDDLHRAEQVCQRPWNVETVEIAPDGDGVLRYRELFHTPLQQKTARGYRGCMSASSVMSVSDTKRGR